MRGISVPLLEEYKRPQDSTRTLGASALDLHKLSMILVYHDAVKPISGMIHVLGLVGHYEVKENRKFQLRETPSHKVCGKFQKVFQHGYSSVY